MKSRQTLRLTVLAVLSLAACASQNDAPRPNAQGMNVVLIVADDLGYGDLSAYNPALYYRTPNIDRLILAGTRFHQAYVTAAICSPSRAALHSGRYQARFGHDFNTRETPEHSLPKEVPTVAEGMKQAGYRTALIGKWHVGREPGYDPPARGFDEYWGFGEGALFIGEPEPGDSIILVEGQQPVTDRKSKRIFTRGRDDVTDESYLTDIVTRESLAFIDRAKDDPFYLVVSHHAPHVPIEAIKTYMDRAAEIPDLRKRTYAAMMIALDDSVGAIMDRLNAHGIADRTVVMFLSDNGCPDYASDMCSNGPLTGHKRELREGGIRTPMSVRYPGVTQPGGQIDLPTVSMDLAATTLAIAGAPATAIDGRDLTPYLKGRAQGPIHKQLFWRAGPARAVREGDWKLLVAPKQGGGERIFLFNLREDPGETKDVSDSNPEVVARLAAAYASWDVGNVPAKGSPRSVNKEFLGTPVEVKF